MLPGQVEYAGFGRRAAACVLDGLIFSVLFALLLAPLAATPWACPLHTLLPAVTAIVLWHWLGGTPGKLLLECQVVDARSHGPLPLARGGLRYLGYLLSALPLGLGFVWMLRDPRRQTWHDKLAGSVVLLGPGLERDDESCKGLARLMAEVR